MEENAWMYGAVQRARHGVMDLRSDGKSERRDSENGFMAAPMDGSMCSDWRVRVQMDC